MKSCNKCNIDKKIEEFGFKKSNKSGLSSICKPCHRSYYKNYTQNNLQQVRENKRKYEQNNKDKKRKYRLKNRDRKNFLERERRRKLRMPIKRLTVEEKKLRASITSKLYRDKNKDRIKLNNFKFRQNNPNYAKEKSREYRHKNLKDIRIKENIKLNTDILFKLKKNLRINVSKVMQGKLKGGSAVKQLGCSSEDLKQHLEAQFYGGMTWDNYGAYWVIDHILPLSSFDLTDREQFLKACHYTNLQPLTLSHNSTKRDKILTKEELEALKAS